MSAARRALAIQTGCEVRRARRSTGSLTPAVTRSVHASGLALADASHDGVDEPGGPGPVDLPGQADRLVDRRVAGHAHAEQLVRAEPQGVEHVGIDLVDGAACSRRDDRVVEAGEPRRAVDQLGGESGVAAADSLVAQQFRQREVGVGAVGDLTHRGVGGESRRIGATGALGGSLLRTVPGRALTCRWPLTLSPSPVAAGAGRRLGRLVARHSSPTRSPASMRVPRAQSAAGHRLLAVCLHRAQSHGPGAGADEDGLLRDDELPGAQWLAAAGRRRARRPSPGATLSRSPRNVVQAPGAGVQPAHEPVDRRRRPGQTMRASSTSIFGASETPSAGCGTARARPPRARPGWRRAGRRRPSASRASRSPAVSVGRIVSVMTPNTGPGVEALAR